MFNTWSSALNEAYKEVLVRLGNFIPELFGAVVVFLVGWLVAWLLQKLVDPVLRGVVDPLWEVIKLEDLRKKAKIDLDITGLLSRFVFWIVLAIAFLASMEVLGLSTVAQLFNQVIGYVPNVLAALVILILGLVLANFLKVTVKATMSASELPHSALLSSVTYWSVVVFVIVAGLVQLNIAKDLLMILFQGLVAGVAVALGLAFGFGGKDWASKVIDSLGKEVKESEKKEMMDEEI